MRSCVSGCKFGSRRKNGRSDRYSEQFQEYYRPYPGYPEDRRGHEGLHSVGDPHLQDAVRHEYDRDPEQAVGQDPEDHLEEELPQLEDYEYHDAGGSEDHELDEKRARPCNVKQREHSLYIEKQTIKNSGVRVAHGRKTEEALSTQSVHGSKARFGTETQALAHIKL